MTAKAGDTAVTGVTGRAPGDLGLAHGREAGRTARSRYLSGWLALLPAVVTAVIVDIGITVPSYWRDEAATVAAVQRPLGALVRMLGHVDAVHGFYYLLLWPITQLFGTGAAVTRMPSLIAMAVPAGLLTAIGRRLASPGIGVTAGLVFAVAPSVTVYGQMARSYALVTMVAATASYGLVRALEEDASRVRWLWYAVSIAALGAMNIFALLLIPSHAITMYLRYRRPDASARRRAVFRRWLIAAGIGFVINVPLMTLASQQRVQIDWLPPVRLSDLGNVADQLGPPWMTVAIAATALAGTVVTFAGRRRAIGRAPAEAGASIVAAGQPRRASAGWGALCALCLPWLVVPPVLLLLATMAVAPVYTQRYILFCTPAAALMVAVALAAVARMPGPRLAGQLTSATVLVVIAALGLSMQVQYRQPWGHADDIRELDAIMASAARPGDAVIYTWPLFLPMSAAYPYGLAKVANIQVSQPAIPSGTLAGTTVPPALLRQRISHARRLWIVQVSGFTQVGQVLNGMHLHLAWTWQTSDMWLQLYVRDSARTARTHG